MTSVYNEVNHQFNKDIAVKFGIPKACLIANIAYWMKRNSRSKAKNQQGKIWMFNSSKAFAQSQPYISEKQVQRYLLQLEKEGAIKSGNYSPHKYDRTKWYTIIDYNILSLYFGADYAIKTLGHMCPMHKTDQSNALSNIVQPIPLVNTLLNAENKQKTAQVLLGPITLTNKSKEKRKKKKENTKETNPTNLENNVTYFSEFKQEKENQMKLHDILANDAESNSDDYILGKAKLEPEQTTYKTGQIHRLWRNTYSKYHKGGFQKQFTGKQIGLFKDLCVKTEEEAKDLVFSAVKHWKSLKVYIVREGGFGLGSVPKIEHLHKYMTEAMNWLAKRNKSKSTPKKNLQSISKSIPPLTNERVPVYDTPVMSTEELLKELGND